MAAPLCTHLYVTGAVTVWPSVDFTVTVAGVAGPKPVVVTATRQRAPVVVAVSVAFPGLPDHRWLLQSR